MFKKTLKATALLSSLAIMVGIAKPINVDAATTYVMATGTVNVRSGASKKYKVVDKLSKGEKVKVLSSSGDWHKVQFDGNEVGWSHENYINKTSSSSSSNSGSSMNVARKLTVKAYAYTGGGYTATGTKAKYGTLAVDPKVIPYGTKVYIKELDKVFTAEDCGGGIKGNKVDIYMNSQSACRNWGVKTITLQILK